MSAVGDDVGLVLNDPLNNLSLLKLHRLRNSTWEVDVVLVSRFLTSNELDLRWISHKTPPMHMSLA